jgi:uncharacterized membrane protein
MPTNTLSTDKAGLGDRSKASAWARSRGYPVPTELNGCLGIFLVVVGLCIYIIPGLVILVILYSINKSYNSEMDALVARWVDAGKPEPGTIKNEININKREIPSSIPQTMTDSLNEIEELRAKGLIEEDEYKKLRIKVLGLE